MLLSSENFGFTDFVSGVLSKIKQKYIMSSNLPTNVVIFIILIAIIGVGVFMPSVLNIFGSDSYSDSAIAANNQYNKI